MTALPEDRNQRFLHPEQIKQILNELNVGYRPSNDPFFNAGNALKKPFVRLGIYSYANEEEFHKQLKVQCNVPGCEKEFDTVFNYESHYNLLHRYLCSQCRKNLPSAHLLDLHISEKHDSFFAVQVQRGEKPMYACYLEECHTMSEDPEQRKDHCITVHRFPHNFRFELRPKTVESVSKSAMEVDVNEPIKPSVIAAKKMKSITGKTFIFGHVQPKTFSSSGNYTKALTHNPNGTRKKTSTILTDNAMVDDLMDSLPQ